MKTRIVVYKNELEVYEFHPQRKILFFWKTFTHTEYGGFCFCESSWTKRDIFPNLEQAKEFIDKKLAAQLAARETDKKSKFKKVEIIKYP